MDDPAKTPANVAETIRDILADKADVTPLSFMPGPGDHLALFSVPASRRIEDQSAAFRKALEHWRPLRRHGTSQIDTLDSLIAWADRFKGDGTTAALFADPDQNAPSLTCVANWHLEGGAAHDGLDATAQHGDHRGVYAFPVSIEWNRWTGLSGQKLSKDQLAEFLNRNIKDVLVPSPAMLTEEATAEQDWERQMIEIATLIDGRFASPSQLIGLSRAFSVNEATKYKHVRDATSGSGAMIEAIEHVDDDGGPVKVPNLFIIGIPVFEGGERYPLAVQLIFRLAGGLSFWVEVYDPLTAFRDAFTHSVEQAAAETELPLFYGKP